MVLEGDSKMLHILLGTSLKKLDSFLYNKENLIAVKIIQRQSIIPKDFKNQFS